MVSFMSLFKIYGTLFQSSQVVRDGRKIVGDLKTLEQKRRQDRSIENPMQHVSKSSGEHDHDAKQLWMRKHQQNTQKRAGCA